MRAATWTTALDATASAIAGKCRIGHFVQRRVRHGKCGAGRLVVRLAIGSAKNREHSFQHQLFVAPLRIGHHPTCSTAAHTLVQRTDRRNEDGTSRRPGLGQRIAERFRPRGWIQDEGHAIVVKEFGQVGRVVSAVYGEYGVVSLPWSMLYVHVADQHEAHPRTARTREGNQPLEPSRPLVRPDRAQHRNGRRAVVRQGNRCRIAIHSRRNRISHAMWNDFGGQSGKYRSSISAAQRDGAILNTARRSNCR